MVKWGGVHVLCTSSAEDEDVVETEWASPFADEWFTRTPPMQMVVLIMQIYYYVNGVPSLIMHGVGILIMRCIHCHANDMLEAY